MHVGHFAAQHDDRAMAAVVPRVREFERVGTFDLHLPVVVAREAHPGEGDGVVEELQLIALAGRASGAHRALARLQAIGPEQRAEHDHREQRQCFPHEGRRMEIV